MELMSISYENFIQPERVDKTRQYRETAARAKKVYFYDFCLSSPSKQHICTNECLTHNDTNFRSSLFVARSEKETRWYENSEDDDALFYVPFHDKNWWTKIELSHESTSKCDCEISITFLNRLKWILLLIDRLICGMIEKSPLAEKSSKKLYLKNSCLSKLTSKTQYLIPTHSVMPWENMPLHNFYDNKHVFSRKLISYSSK
jgi:hypothetical protein